jgi:hypothetical protein
MAVDPAVAHERTLRPAGLGVERAYCTDARAAGLEAANLADLKVRREGAGRLVRIHQRETQIGGVGAA